MRQIGKLDDLNDLPQEIGSKITVVGQNSALMQELWRRGFWIESLTPALAVMRRDFPADVRLG